MAVHWSLSEVNLLDWSAKKNLIIGIKYTVDDEEWQFRVKTFSEVWKEYMVINNLVFL